MLNSKLSVFSPFLLAVGLATLFIPDARAVDFSDTAAINTMLLKTNWSGGVFTNYMDEIWMRSFYLGTNWFDWRIAAGGDVGEMRECDNSFTAMLDDLTPGFTDGVMQWVTWDTNQIGSSCYDSSSPSVDKYNLNQAGTVGDENSPPDANSLAPTVTVHVTNSPVPQVDVYSLPQDQWTDCMQSYYKQTNSVLTRYRLIGPGCLMIRRVIMFGEVYKDGVLTNLSHLNLQAFNPFGRQVFDGLALAMDSSGTPTWHYDMGNLPTSSTFDVSYVRGFASVYCVEYPYAACCSFIFGTNNCQTYTNQIGSNVGTFDLNFFLYAYGVVPYPNLHMDFELPAGSVIDQYFVVYPNYGMTPTFYTNTYSMVTNIPPPRLFWPTTTVDGELSTIISNLQNNYSVAGTRKNDLVTLIDLYDEE